MGVLALKRLSEKAIRSISGAVIAAAELAK